MIKKDHFNELIERSMLKKTRTHMRPAIAKELLHYDILFALENENLLDSLTFQDGTCLRLCYNAPRFSEDLDLVGGKSFTTKALINMKSCLEHHIGERYGLEITVKKPNETSALPELRDIKVDEWQMRITTEPEKKYFPKQKIKIEVANIPAYTRSPQSLKVN